MRDNAKIVKSIAADLGFSFCGISKAEFLEEEAPRLTKWLKEGKQGGTSYMENHFDKRWILLYWFLELNRSSLFYSITTILKFVRIPIRLKFLCMPMAKIITTWLKIDSRS